MADYIPSPLKIFYLVTLEVSEIPLHVHVACNQKQLAGHTQGIAFNMLYFLRYHDNKIPTCPSRVHQAGQRRPSVRSPVLTFLCKDEPSVLTLYN